MQADISIDRVTGERAPIGYITGFPSTHIRSTWPGAAGLVVGKRLTDKRIAYYQAHGFYGKNGILALRKLEALEKEKERNKPKTKAQTKAQRAKLSREQLMKLFV